MRIPDAYSERPRPRSAPSRPRAAALRIRILQVDTEPEAPRAMHLRAASIFEAPVAAHAPHRREPDSPSEERPHARSPRQGSAISETSHCVLPASAKRAFLKSFSRSPFRARRLWSPEWLERGFLKDRSLCSDFLWAAALSGLVRQTSLQLSILLQRKSHTPVRLHLTQQRGSGFCQG